MDDKLTTSEKVALRETALRAAMQLHPSTSFAVGGQNCNDKPTPQTVLTTADKIYEGLTKAK